MDDYPWAMWPWQRCKAVLEPNNDTGYFGRCDLMRGHGEETVMGIDGTDHALERGMEIVLWMSTPRVVPGWC